jgi:hypothetical protein
MNTRTPRNMSLAALTCLTLSMFAPGSLAQSDIQQQDSAAADTAPGDADSSGLEVRKALGMPTGLPSLLLKWSLPHKKEEADVPDSDKSPVRRGMYNYLEECMIKSLIGKRFKISAPKPDTEAEGVQLFKLAPRTDDTTFSTDEIARFLLHVEYKSSGHVVVSGLELTKAPDPDAWQLGLEVTHFDDASQLAHPSALTTWIRLTHAVGESPEVRVGADLTKLAIAVQQDHSTLVVSGTVASLQAYDELIAVVSSLPASTEVTPGMVSDSSMTFTGLKARLGNDE